MRRSDLTGTPYYREGYRNDLTRNQCSLKKNSMQLHRTRPIQMMKRLDRDDKIGTLEMNASKWSNIPLSVVCTTSKSKWTATHLHAHLAKGNLTPGKGWDTPRGLEPHWHSIQCGAGSTSVTRSQPSAIQGDAKSASDL